MRNSNQRYVSLAEDGQYRSPGCSIDPSPRLLTKLEEQGLPPPLERGQAAASPLIEEWFRLARERQNVRIIGVPPSRAAATMVDADYLLKRITNGSEDPGEGFESLLDMRVDGLRSGNGAENGPSLNRFWFHPSSDVRVLLGEKGVLIENVSVQLSTEAEYLTANEVVGTGEADPLAAEFAATFTSSYSRMRRIYPIYEDLENLFWLVALTKVMRQTQADGKSGIDLSYLLDRLPLPLVEVPEDVVGVSRIHSIALPDDPGLWERFGRLFDGDESHPPYHRIRLSLAGGVSTAIALTEKSFAEDEDGRVAAMADAARRARPAPSSLVWDYDSDRLARSAPGRDAAHVPRMHAGR